MLLFSFISIAIILVLVIVIVKNRRDRKEMTDAFNKIHKKPSQKETESNDSESSV